MKKFFSLLGFDPKKLSYVLVKLLTGRARELLVCMYIIAIVFFFSYVLDFLK